MTAPFLEAFADLMAARGVQVTRFNFPYMAAFQSDGRRRPPPRMSTLCAAYREVVQHLAQARPADAPIFIGGKSMGGRVATMIADELFAFGACVGVVCLGYPFHPKGKPEKLRTAHLKTIRAPVLIVQGERDGLGNREEIAGYNLGESVSVDWAKDGDHDLKPRQKSGVTLDDNLTFAADAVAAWLQQFDVV